jgi:hypothetical protein
MYCGWQPTTIDEMSRSERLSRYTFSTWKLLEIGRGIVAGRKATEVVVNLAEIAAEDMADPEARKDIESVLGMRSRSKKTTIFAGMKRRLASTARPLIFVRTLRSAANVALCSMFRHH